MPKFYGHIKYSKVENYGTQEKRQTDNYGMWRKWL